MFGGLSGLVHVSLVQRLEVYQERRNATLCDKKYLPMNPELSNLHVVFFSQIYHSSPVTLLDSRKKREKVTQQN